MCISCGCIPGASQVRYEIHLRWVCISYLRCRSRRACNPLHAQAATPRDQAATLCIQVHESEPCAAAAAASSCEPPKQSFQLQAELEERATGSKRKACPPASLQRRKRSRTAAAPVEWAAVLAQHQQRVEVLTKGGSPGWLVEILHAPDANGRDCRVEWPGWLGSPVPAKLAHLSLRN